MAELIGVVSGVAGLVHLTLVVSQASHEYVQKVRNAPKTTLQYLREVLALSVVLLRLEEVLSLPGVATALSVDNDLLPKSLIAECQKELESIKQKLQKRTTPGHGFKSIQALYWPFEEKEMKHIVENLARWNNIFTSLASTCGLRMSNDTIIAAQTQKHDDRRTVVLDWISSNASVIDTNDVFQDYCEDTYLWILEDKKYLDWQDGAGKTLFCTGGPGVGKTTFTSFLINHIIATKPTSVHVLYHYFDFRAEQKANKVVAVVRSLLRQLLEQKDQLPEDIISLHKKSRQAKFEITDKVWIDTMCKQISSSPQIFIMLDGYDECPDRFGLSRLFRCLKHTAAKLYIAGRPPIDLATDINDRRDVEMLAREADLNTYIQSRLESDEELGPLLTESLNDEIITTLIDHAAGVFLLAKLALDNLTGFTTVRQIRKALLNVPKDLRSAYQVTFDRIMSSHSAQRALALKSLSWILSSRRPLSMTELLHALAMEEDDNEIDLENLTTPKTVLGVCLGYLDHNESDDLVRLTHATVREFLEHECAAVLEPYKFGIAQICVKYLAQPAFALDPCPTLTDMITRLTDFPLLPYAASYWGFYALEYQEDLTTEISNLLRTQNAVTNAAQVFHYLRRTKGQLTEKAFTELPQAFGKMHLLALWGLKTIAVLESPTHAEITAPDSLGWTPLHWAAARGHSPMLEFLLSHGADVESKDLRCWTPLFWAVFWSRGDAVCHLADKGANIMSKDIDGNTPLHIAVSRGNPEICTELLRRNASWSVKSPSWGSPYDQAIRSQNPAIAGMFLDLQKPHPMAAVAGQSSDHTVLERYADCFPAAPDSVFRATLEGETTAAERSDWPRPLLPRLQQYAERLQQKDPHRLCRIGANVGFPWFEMDVIDQDDYVAGVLSFAILTENIPMVKALIDIGVNLNKVWSRRYTRLDEYQFPALLASYVGSLELLDLVLCHGASVDVADFDGQTPLHYAVILGRTEMAQKLCTHKQLLNAQDSKGESALHLVWTKLLRAQHDRRWPNSAPVIVTAGELASFLEIAQLLVRNGADVNGQNRSGNTPLHEAVQTGEIEAVKTLIELGANVNIRARNEARSLSLFSERDEEDPLKTAKFGGHTPFTLACENHELGIASILHEAGSVLPVDMDLRKPSLERAVADADLTALQTLFSFSPSATHVAGPLPFDASPLLIVAIRSLQWVMDEKTQDETDFRPPFIAPSKHIDAGAEAVEKYGLIVDYLLLVGEDPNGTDNTGTTALLEALKDDYNTKIVDMLLRHGANVQAVDDSGRNALHVAAACGSIPYVKLLLSYKTVLNRKSHDGTSPISLAAANGHGDVVSLLLTEETLDSSADSHFLHDWLLLSQCYNAIGSRDIQQAQNLLSQSPPLTFVDRAGRTLLHLAADTGVEELVSTLLSSGIDVNMQDNRGDTALHIAAASKTSNSAIIKMLVDHGAGLETRNHAGDTYEIQRIPHDALALHLAAYAGNLDIVKALLDCLVTKFGERKALGMEPGAPKSPLPERPRFYRELPLIDATSDACGRTPLMCAVQAGDVAIVRHLLDQGANVNASGGRGSWGFNALDLALPETHRMTRFDSDGAEPEGKQVKTSMVTLLESHGAVEFEW